MKNSIYLKNQKRPFSSIGVALPKILPSKIDPEIDPKSSQNRCTCKTKNNDSVREGVTKSIKKPTKIDQKFMQIDQRSVSKSVQNRSQNRSNFGVQKVDTSRTESLFLGIRPALGPRAIPRPPSPRTPHPIFNLIFFLLKMKRPSPAGRFPSSAQPSGPAEPVLAWEREAR